jgi:hypothetical protein
MKVILLVPALIGLAACVPATTSTRPAAPVTAVAPSTEDILWARKDGRRMSGNPELFQQGTLDKQACEAEASAGGTLDFPTFASCMNRSGYIQMRRAG